jgi:two-component system LytT family response regulator
MTDATMRVLIVDDEPLGCARIANLLRNEAGVEVVGTAGNGEEAITAIRELRPDLVFLDVQMPKKSGLEVVREIGPQEMPPTIFVTAYDQYALKAFDSAAVDYLVKPYDNERFAEAFRRARRIIELEGKDRLWAQLMAVLQAGTSPPPPGGPVAANPQPRYLERIAVPSKGKTRLIPVSEIDYLTASGQYVELHTGGRRQVIRESLQRLEQQLDPDRFMRIHRSVIVRLELIDTLLRAEGGDYEVQLKSGVRLRLSRYKREALERRLGGA